MYRIVISVRDAQLFLLLRHLLAREGFDTVLAQCSADIEASLSPDIVAFLIEGSTERHDATSLVAVVRSSCPDAALIILRRGEVAHTELEAEFVLEPPFEPAKLLEFLRSLRPHGMPRNRSDLLGFDDLTMDLSSMVVRRGECKVHLSALQYRILRLLLEDPGAVRDREAFITACWPPGAEVEPRTVDIHIGHIRRALEACGPDLIRTVRGAGYALCSGKGDERSFVG